MCRVVGQCALLLGSLFGGCSDQTALSPATQNQKWCDEKPSHIFQNIENHNASLASCKHSINVLLEKIDMQMALKLACAYRPGRRVTPDDIVQFVRENCEKKDQEHARRIAEHIAFFGDEVMLDQYTRDVCTKKFPQFSWLLGVIKPPKSDNKFEARCDAHFVAHPLSQNNVPDPSNHLAVSP